MILQESVPRLDWAMTQNNLGNALKNMLWGQDG
jgi:hypothetical protein